MSWIENTLHYQWHYEQSLNQVAPHTCYFCGGKISGAPHQIMRNGFVFHQQCYDRLYGRIAALKDEAEAKDLFVRFSHLLSGFTLLHTYWPTYPPDWNVRREYIVRKAGFKCEDCGESEDILDVHHLQPLAKGGNHARENLIALCRSCHAEYHKNHELGRPDASGKRKSAFDMRVELLKRAIEQKADIRLDYINQAKERSRGRLISPKSFRTSHGYLMLKAHCHIDHIIKSFNIRRMSKLRILEPDKSAKKCTPK